MAPTETDLWRKKLTDIGIEQPGVVHWNASTAELYEHSLRRGEDSTIVHLGPLRVTTGTRRGRSPRDKFIVKEPTSAEDIWWAENEEFSGARYDSLRGKILQYLKGKDLFVQDCFVCAHAKYRMPIRIITQRAWHNLFARNMFIRVIDREQLLRHEPEFTLIHAPAFHSSPEQYGTNSEAFIGLNFGKKEGLICGTSYGGEIKKSIFTMLNYYLPQQGVLPMHCSANVGKDSDVALFFGLSGTGKTTLSADPNRRLIGDDEHGWCDDGTFNFEGGCYAKVIGLREEAEPQIYRCTRRFGTILENVGMDFRTRRLDLDDAELTENTRAAYPVNYMQDIVKSGCAGHPSNVIFLTCDAYGVMPPVSKLSRDQAMYHFLTGYTAKVAGTEAGVDEPMPEFSACFGAPFMAREPHVYAEMLGRRLDAYGSDCWLVNTGWVGGDCDSAKRMPIAFTRAIITAILSGSLASEEYVQEPVFGLHVPKRCSGVPDEKLDARGMWPDKGAYDAKAAELAELFKRNFKSAGIPNEFASGGPVA